MGEIIIRYVCLPPSIKAYTLTDSNDDYNIYVNSALNSIRQQQAVDHELRHIRAGVKTPAFFDLPKFIWYYNRYC